MNEITCEVCRDLLPLVRDGIASEESCQAARLHMKSCASCAAFFEECAPPPAANGEKLLRQLRRQLRFGAALLLLLCVFVGVGLTAGEGLFYNSLLMPVVGVLGYCLFRKKSFYRIPVLILLLHAVTELIRPISQDEALDWYTVFVYSVIYSLLALAGALAAFFFHRACGKKGEKRAWVKALCLAAALVLTAGVGLFANAFVGNPVSYFLAQSGAKKYLSEKYAGTDYALDSVSFSFKMGSYFAYVQAPGSEDRQFTIWLDGGGRVAYDDYESRVEDGWNTARRLSEEYRALTDRVLESPSFPFQTHIEFGDLEFLPRDAKADEDAPEYGIFMDTLTPDGIYDVAALGARAGHLTVYIEDGDVSAARAAQLLREIKRLMDAGGAPFYVIDLVLEAPRGEDGTRPEGRVEVRAFRYDEIEGGGLVERVRKANEETAAYYAKLDAEKRGGA